jgi:hypothetical protein
MAISLVQPFINIASHQAGVTNINQIMSSPEYFRVLGGTLELEKTVKFVDTTIRNSYPTIWVNNPEWYRKFLTGNIHLMSPEEAKKTMYVLGMQTGTIPFKLPELPPVEQVFLSRVPIIKQVFLTLLGSNVRLRRQLIERVKNEEEEEDYNLTGTTGTTNLSVPGGPLVEIADSTQPLDRAGFINRSPHEPLVEIADPTQPLDRAGFINRFPHEPDAELPQSRLSERVLTRKPSIRQTQVKAVRQMTM